MEENENENENLNSNNQTSVNGFAIAGFIVSLCSLIINFGGIVGLVGTILSAVGLAQVKTKGKGKGLAIAGIIIGIFSIVYGIFTIVTVITTLNGGLFDAAKNAVDATRSLNTL